MKSRPNKTDKYNSKDVNLINIKEIQELLNSGRTAYKHAKVTGISLSTVHKYMQQENLDGLTLKNAKKLQAYIDHIKSVKG